MEQYLPSGQFYSAGDRMWPVPYFVFPDFTISQWTCFTKSFSKTKRFYSKHQEESGVKQASYLSTPLPPTCQLISSIVFKKWTLSEFPGGLVLLPLLLGLLLWHMFHPWPGKFHMRPKEKKKDSPLEIINSEVLNGEISEAFPPKIKAKQKW